MSLIKRYDTLCMCIGDQMYDLLWEAVSHLERGGFRVMGLVCDGLAANHILMSLSKVD